MRLKDISILRTLFFAHLPRRSRYYRRRGSFVIHFSWYSNEWNAHYTFSYWCCCFLCAPAYMFRQRVLVIFLPMKSKKEKKKVRVPTRSQSPPPPISFISSLWLLLARSTHTTNSTAPVYLYNDGQCYNSGPVFVYRLYLHIRHSGEMVITASILVDVTTIPPPSEKNKKTIQ